MEDIKHRIKKDSVTIETNTCIYTLVHLYCVSECGFLVIYAGSLSL